MINVWSYLEELEIEKNEIMSAIEDVLLSGKLILGPQVENFENEFSNWCGSKFGIGVGNGTDAILLACKALGIGSGDEVITVSNTAVPTVSAIVACGAVPVFVDINPETYLMDTNQIQSKLSKKTKLILAVHLYGQTVDMDPIMDIAKNNALFVIEDCAQAHGAYYGTKCAGTIGDIGAFSFYPTKILGTYGDGGLCLTNDKKISEKLLRLRFYGMESTYYSLEHGYNSRLDELHAAILRKKLNNLNMYLERRRNIASRYFDGLEGSSYILPNTAPNNLHSYYVFVVQHDYRERIIKELKEQGINVNISYPYPIHTMEGFSDLGYKKGDLPITEHVSSRIFSLPMYPNLSNNDQDFVIKMLKKLDK